MNAHDLIFPDKGLAGKILLPIEGKYVRGIEGISGNFLYADLTKYYEEVLPVIKDTIYFVSLDWDISDVIGVEPNNLLYPLITDYKGVRVALYNSSKVNSADNTVGYYRGSAYNCYISRLEIAIKVGGWQNAGVSVVGYKLLLGDL